MSRLLIFGLLLAVPTLAQTRPSPQIKAPQNLAEALRLTYWNTEERGPLLAVAPLRVTVRRTQGKYTPPPLPPENGYNALDISAFFDHQPFRAGGVTVVAPKTMRRFTRPTMPPEQAVSLSREEASLELMASLSPGQWKQLGSENGMGLDDLSEAQKPYFLTLLPRKMTLHSHADLDDKTIPPQEPRDLNVAQRERTRLRMARRLQLSYYIEGKENQLIDFVEAGSANQPFELRTSYTTSEEDNPSDPLAARLYPKVPNRLKPSDMDYAHPRLSPPVTLRDLKTVGELLNRIGAATQLTFKADYRVTNLDLYSRGESARSGDVLQALSHGVCGAFRKINSNTYLLTEDREGLTTRQAAYDQWMEKVQELRLKRQDALVKKMVANGAAVPTDNPEGISPETLKQAGDFFRPLKPGEEPGIAASELPASLQRRIQEAGNKKINRRDESGTLTPIRIRTDRVSLRSELQTLWVLPGIGSFPSEGLNISWPLDLALRHAELFPKIPEIKEGPLFAPHWKNRVLVLAPQSVEEAQKAVSLAKDGGFNTLWVLVPLDPVKAKVLLEAALPAGKAAGIAVGVQVSTLAPATDPLLDLNALGEPSNAPALWFSPTLFRLPPTPTVAQRLTTLINKLAQLPGVASLNFSGVFPSYERNYSELSHKALGYLPENRTAFFAQTGSDTFDLPNRSNSQYPVLLGHFSNLRPDSHNQDMVKSWREFRQRQLQTFLNTLDTPMKSLPYPGYSPVPNSRFIGLWQRPERPSPSDDTIGPVRPAQARRLSPVVLQQLSPASATKPEDILSGLRRMTTEESMPEHRTDGIVLDFSTRPFEEAKSFIMVLTN